MIYGAEGNLDLSLLFLLRIRRSKILLSAPLTHRPSNVAVCGLNTITNVGLFSHIPHPPIHPRRRGRDKWELNTRHTKGETQDKVEV